jgi:hydrophobe/amphiphile efflux-1 (HAE1) family protein
MRNISSWAIKNPIPPIVLFIVLFFLGIASFARMQINNMPDISFPMISVTVSMPGAAPAELEKQVTQRIEGAVASIGNVKRNSSRIIEGQSLTQVEFQVGTPVDRAVTDVRDAVAKVRADLPDGIQEPVVERQQVDGGPIAYYSVSTTDMTLEQLSWFVDNTITRRLLAINGVANVNRGGGVSREIRIMLDPARLQAFGLTAVQINTQLRQLNLDAAGGRAEIAGSEQSLRVLGGAHTAQQLGETQIAIPGGRMIRLSDIAEVRDANSEQRTIAKLNGRQVTTFGVSKAKGASDVTVWNDMQTALTKLKKENPQVNFDLIFTTVDYTKIQYHSAIDAMIEGAVLAVLVVWLFLRDWRATFIAALAIPLSAIPAFWLMDLMGFTLNTISLLALSLVAGILVDDAIVEIENIVRHMRMGKSPYQAALEAADEIGMAVVATTSAIIAVFVPVSFMGGISGQFFKQFGLTVASAVLMSLLVARLITPLVAAYFLKPHGHQPHGEGKWMERYLALLRWTMNHRWKTLGVGALAFVVTIFLFAQLPTAFQPDIDQGNSTVNIELPPGVRLEDSERVVDSLVKIIRARPEVKSAMAFVGDGDEVRNSQIVINLVDTKHRKVTTTQFEHEMSKQFVTVPDARVSFQSQGNGFGRDITVMLAGDDPVLLNDTAHKIEREMQGLSVLRDARIDGDLSRPEIVITPRLDVAASMGVSVSSLSQTIRIATIGDIPQNLAKFSLTDRQIPIRVSLLESSRKDLSTLENLPVPTASGGAVPLKVVADISFGEGPTKIRRYNQARRIVIGADRNGAELGDVMKAVAELPTMKHLPQGIQQIPVGDAEIMGELVTNFLLAIGAGVMMVFAVLVLLYRRALPPLVNMGSLLLAPLGAAIALMISGFAVTMPVYIGILMLFGIVAKNSILLVDFAIEEMRDGVDRMHAILDAGHKRAQPIVMTTVAMVAGMLPIAFGLSGDSSFRAPMAVTVIGGLIVSTALTLIIVPAGFTLADDLEKWIAPRFGKLLSNGETPPVRPHRAPAE